MGALRLIAFLLVLAAHAAAQTTTTGSGDQATVKAWHASASNGDTYIMEPGTWTWATHSSARIEVTKQVTIFGSGWGAGGTIIEVNRTITSNASPIIEFDTSNFRLSNFEIRNETVDNETANASSAEMIVVTNGAQDWSIDNLKVTHDVGHDGMRIIGVKGGDTNNSIAGGVVWGCEFATEETYLSYVKNGGEPWGDYAWGNAVPKGTDDMIVFEDNTIGYRNTIDGVRGAVVTVRFNQFFDSYIHGHGTASTFRERGIRWYEVYNNTFEWDIVGDRTSMVEVRSGGGLVFNNVITPDPVTGEPDTFLVLNNYRTIDPYAPWFYADGLNDWDVAYTDDTGTGFDSGSAGDGIYETGTLTSVTDDLNFQDSSKSGVWGSNDWAGFTLRMVGPSITAAAGSTGNSIVVSPDPGWTTNKYLDWAIKDTSTGRWNRITGNTSDTITTETLTSDNLPNFSVSPGDTFVIYLSQLIDSSDSSGNIVLEDSIHGNMVLNGEFPVAVGDTYEIRKVRTVIDGIGRGTGNYADLGSTSSPVVFSDWTQAVGEQPWYEWGNASTGSVGVRVAPGVSAGFTINEDVEYFEHNASFDGTSGVGVGTKAEMNAITPTTDNVAFWVTDEADWNKTTPGVADGQLYVGNGSAWSLYYTPREYPHPLRATLAALPGAVGAAYGGRLRFNGTGSQPVLTDQTGSVPIKTN